MSFTLSGGKPTVEVSASAAIVSNGANSSTIRVTANAWFVYSGSYVYSSGVVAKVTCNGTTKTATLFGNGSYWYYSDGTATKTFDFAVSEGTSSKSVSWSVAFHSYIDGSDLGNKATKSGSVTVGAMNSYTVSYNANGGSGAPSNQTKWYNTALTLSTTKPTRPGHSFKNWNTASGGTGTTYASGASYTSNAALTLYAQWTANTYTVSYDANGGSGAPSSQTKTYGVNLTLSGTKPARTNYNFLGWSTSATGSVEYAAGATYSANSAVTLYAVWELAYWKPKITNLAATRCDSNGTANEYGTYAKITFNWELCQLIGTNTTATVDIDWGDDVTTITKSGSSGSVSQVIGAGKFSIEASYQFVVKVTDNTDYTKLYVTFPASSFAIDFKSGGTGVAFGKPASTSNLLDSAWPIAEKGTSLVDRYRRLRCCRVGNPNADSTAYWRKFASIPISAIGTHGDTFISFRVTATFGSGTDHTGILHAHVRTGSDSCVESVHFTWEIANSKIDISHFVLAYPTSATSGDIELWMYDDTDWRVTTFEVIHETNNYMSRYQNDGVWTLHSVVGNGSASVTSGYTTVTSNISPLAGLGLKNSGALYGANASGAYRNLVHINGSNASNFGYGGYAASEGSTGLYGNVIDIFSKGAINITSPTAGLSGRAYGANKTLWSGGMYMNASQTATLSQAVSAQPHGIVLVFSSYSNNAADDAQFHSFFVPKALVANHPGKGSQFVMVSSNTPGSFRFKYLYINDTSMTGHADNVKTGTTSSGVSITNNGSVLRYVYGV